MLNLNKCYLVFALSMNMIRSCLLQYGYSLKTENNCYSVYMNKTFYGHTPHVDGNTHIHGIDAKNAKLIMIVQLICGISVWVISV